MSVSKPLKETDPKVLESMLKGKTLTVYLYLLQQPDRSVGVREVQRALKFSSPSVAVHHLEKLEDLGLLKKKATGEYIVEEEVKVGILQLFTRVGRFLVPRYLFYSVLFTTMLATYTIICTTNNIWPNLYAFIFGFLAMLGFWLETIRVWRAKPF
ncbi:MAG: helix-turn-helix domain-containing protein [Candidatus Bathyarchaeia archaeon]